MAKINLVKEILQHDDDEIIEFLAEEASAIKATYLKAAKVNTPEALYSIAADITILHSVLSQLDRRNKERKLQ